MKRFSFILASLLMLLGLALAPKQATKPDSPEQPVKLVFIHHSTGENWLTDGYGDLGRRLAENNYFVSDTNYSWGPDAIGDRTDIPNWMEWFRSEQTPRYMEALFNESEQHASYTRTFGDPGGENQIIMFKSCFPNSALEGSQNDPPSAEGDYTVGHAKYVYNEILAYFATRPDKLFIVVTAPPLQDGSLAANARAFNEWLMNDWLRENNYSLPNVAIFDFYTVLTGQDHHHRYSNGQVEHTFKPGKNISVYASSPDDDHPSAAGSRKATDEFVPLLNFFYSRWKGSAPSGPITPVENPPASTQEAAPVENPPVVNNPPAVLADFENGTTNWEAFDDGGGVSTITCAASNQAHGGQQAMQVEYNVAANGWAACNLPLDGLQNWSAYQGVTFYLRAAKAAQVIHVDVYAQQGEERETYVYTLETPPDSVSAWIPVTLRWEDFHRVDWEADAGQPFGKPDQIIGFAFGIPTFQDATSSGTIWVDDLGLLGDELPAQESPQRAESTEVAQQPAATDVPQAGNPLRTGCGGAAALPFAVAGVIWWLGKRRR